MATSLNDATTLVATADAAVITELPTLVALIRTAVTARQEMHNWGGKGQHPRAAQDKANAFDEVVQNLAAWSASQRATATLPGALGHDAVNIHLIIPR